MTTTADAILQALQPYDLRREPDGEYRANSPLRPGSNSHAFHLRVESDGEHGTFIDHVSGEKGSLYDLADTLGVPRAGVQPVADTKRVYKDIDDYGEAHGIPGWALALAGWDKEVTRRKDNRPALTFKTKHGIRYRFIDGQEPKYKSAINFKNSLYKLEEAITIAKGHGFDALIYANGEISTDSAQYHDLPAFCKTGGEANIPAAMVDEIKAAWQGEIWVTFDCDPTGRKAAEAVVKTMTEAGLRAKALDLKLGHKGDLADLCKLHEDGVGEVIKRLPPLGGVKEADPAAAPAAITIRKIIHANLLGTLPPLRYLIKGMIVESGLNLLFGASGVGKSFIALDWALNLAQTANVLYVAREGSSGYDLRCEAWTLANKRGRGNLHFDLSPISLFNAPEVDAFIEAARGVAPKLVVFDTLARCIAGADENSARDAGIVIANCDRIREALGCAVLLVHHTQRGGDNFRGSGVWRDAMDCAVKVEADDDVIKIESSKLKDDEGFKPQLVKLVKFGASVAPLPTDLTTIQIGQPLTGQQRKVLEFLDYEQYRFVGARKADIIEATHIPDGTFGRIINNLIKLTYVSQTKKGQPYSITPLGRQMLQK